MKVMIIIIKIAATPLRRNYGYTPAPIERDTSFDIKNSLECSDIVNRFKSANGVRTAK